MTAVEWLINEIKTKHDKSFIDFYSNEIEQAKEMEKQQIVNSHVIGYIRGAKKKGITGEEYYNETYKGANNEIFKPE